MSLITTTEALAAQCKQLEKEAFITVDTEFLRDKTYFPKLCLVQIAGKDSHFAVDTLARNIDLSPLFELFNNTKILKVFHSARQDLEIIYNLTNKIPTPLFDTQVAAMVCGFGEAASYEILVKKLADVQLDKSSRFTDWSHRPLSKKQLEYALSDVTHLRVVYEKLNALLQENERSHWLTEEMATLTSPKIYKIVPENAWEKLKLRNSQSPRFVKRVQELAKWRELMAQERDIPRNHFFKEQILLEIAATAPKTIKTLQNIRGMSKSAAEEYGGKILSIVQEVEDMPEEKLPLIQLKRTANARNRPLVELLKVLLHMKSDEHKVAAKLIASTDELEIIAAEKEPEVPAMQGWRHEVFGQYAMALKEGKIALAAKGRKMRLVELPSA